MLMIMLFFVVTDVHRIGNKHKAIGMIDDYGWLMGRR